ncbi:MAG: efflux RND transporter periplasmic adaptor subunit [Sinobacteraceae bacterium]|nr:efflux RND transporter periplasmic adaptor subunit [Nevskiaceae bacterium]
MESVQWSGRSPIAVAVIALFIGLLGMLSLSRLPLQLFPDINRPEISIQCTWRTASPEEVESELLEPLENVLQGMPGVEEIEGNANAGAAQINLRFALGTDMKNALVEVIGRLNRLRPLPRDADRPVVTLGGGDGNANETLSWFFVQQLPGTPGTIESQRRFIEDTVRARLEAVPGVAAVNVNAGPPDDVRITVDLVRAAALGIAVPDIAAQAAAANNVSGGQLDVGRRQYTLRFTGLFKPDRLGDLVLAWRDGRPVRLGDLATIDLAPPARQQFGYQNGNPAIGIQVLRMTGANVLGTLEAVKAEVAELREGPLKAHGLGIEQSFDASLFIHRAVNLLSENLLVGTLLALIVVWWFMREARVTMLIALTIPVCLCATFTVLDLFGRSLNVISLAGLAFAVGMVVEGAIVVSGNVVRLRESGLPLQQAAREGARQVAGALVASTATTIAVFVPVLFLKDVEGQLFGDLALTISIAVAISIVVALTLLPVALTFVLDRPLRPSGYGHGWPRLTEWVLRVTNSRPKQLSWIAGLLLIPLALAWWMLPPLDYLPPVKRAAIDAFFNFPPGMSSEAINRELLPTLLERMRPYMEGEKEPRLKNWYILTWPGGGTIGARVQDETRIGELERIVREKIIVGLPDTRAFAAEGDLFGGIGGSARSVGIHLQSEDTAALNRVALEGRTLLERVFPNSAVQSLPNPEDVALELHAVPDDRRIAEVGWDRATLGTVIRTVGEGAWLGEYFDGKSRLPIMLRAREGATPEDLANAPLRTASGLVVRLGDLVQLSTVLGPPAIRRLNHRRTVTLTVDPPESLSLEQVLSTINTEVLPKLRAELPADGSIRMAGSADNLSKTLNTMKRVFGVALFVLLLLMTALFRSIRDSLIVLLTVPLALIGGVVGLRMLDVVKFQALDLLSMIGFVMMIGVIINHAILLVAAVRSVESTGAALEEAIRAGLNQRLRAILASTLTGALGALPMAVNPGPGSVIYRGLAAVNIGGVVVSLVFSLVLIPALMRLLQKKSSRVTAPVAPIPAAATSHAIRPAPVPAAMARVTVGSAAIPPRTINIVLASLLCAVAPRSGHAADQAAGPPVPVQVGTVTERSVSPYSWIPGSIVSRFDARVASVIAGRVVWVADVGLRVKADEPIAKLDDTPAQIRAQDLRAQVARAKAQLVVAAAQLERFDQLAATKVLSVSQLDDARAQSDMAREDVLRAEAQLRQAEYEINQSQIRAPFPGVVTERFIQKGEYVQLGAATVRLVNTADIEARATAALWLAANVRPGQLVSLRDRSQERRGRIRTIVPVGDDRSRQFEVRVVFEGPDWLVGTPVEVSLPSAAERTAITIPRDALVIRQNHSYVLRVSHTNTVEELDVTPGIALTDVVEVSGPLTPGDRLVTRGAERLTAGQAVKVIPREPQTPHSG